MADPVEEEDRRSFFRLKLNFDYFYADELKRTSLILITLPFWRSQIIWDVKSHMVRSLKFHSDFHDIPAQRIQRISS